ncbi:hypothetical protein SODALDRAFT_33960 [Sodiomyces alkalinus F11]|uniref:Uncharacterized protein n=1 Tax=Sodiomyces alkalinus (strain CBS 110278 / VKM F-3762 / F11) TaxID=1314773 RepID=A0A3N2Q8Y0_SODAK|nr:hypothetical protein SODALDRAFT_33960 [Sodiomyces alkalinus F11]ROT43224.1 hypothetical protein SODALDRAFT_33960 [Sodiomyces alkalinus F11]
MFSLSDLYGKTLIFQTLQRPNFCPCSPTVNKYEAKVVVEKTRMQNGEPSSLPSSFSNFFLLPLLLASLTDGWIAAHQARMKRLPSPRASIRPYVLLGVCAGKVKAFPVRLIIPYAIVNNMNPPDRCLYMNRSMLDSFLGPFSYEVHSHPLLA